MDIIKIILPVFIIGLLVIYLVRRAQDLTSSKDDTMAYGMGIGLTMGAGIGIILDQLALAAALGLLIGLIVSLTVFKK